MGMVIAFLGLLFMAASIIGGLVLLWGSLATVGAKLCMLFFVGFVLTGLGAFIDTEFG